MHSIITFAVATATTVAIAITIATPIAIVAITVTHGYNNRHTRLVDPWKRLDGYHAPLESYSKTAKLGPRISQVLLQQLVGVKPRRPPRALRVATREGLDKDATAVAAAITAGEARSR